MEPPERARRRSGAGDYPYDPHASRQGLRDLERLRGISDRTLAEYLHELYSLAERNSRATQGQSTSSVSRHALRLQQTAGSALAGQLGSEARELAEYLLVDEKGRRRGDADSLDRFAKALRKLRAQR